MKMHVAITYQFVLVRRETPRFSASTETQSTGCNQYTSTSDHAWPVFYCCMSVVPCITRPAPAFALRGHTHVYTYQYQPFLPFPSLLCSSLPTDPTSIISPAYRPNCSVPAFHVLLDPSARHDVTHSTNNLLVRRCTTVTRIPRRSHNQPQLHRSRLVRGISDVDESVCSST